MRRSLVILLTALLGMSLFVQPAYAKWGKFPPRAQEEVSTSHFGFMFPSLNGFTTPTVQEIADLAQTMLDPNADSENNPDPEMTSIYTYFGQFVDHDLTLDSSPSPTAPIDPTTLENGRTFKFDLDSVYGKGPFGSPQLYEADHKHFKVQNPNPNGVVDLPRNADGSAILVEPRNDENEIISQIHVAWLLTHNKLIDQGLSFRDAHLRTVRLYQRIVLTDILPHFVGEDLAQKALTPGKFKHFYKPGNPNTPMTPVEFSVAAYRFGHSMVRRAYELTNTTGKLQVFSATAPDLRGGRQLPAGRQIDWGLFVDELTRPDNAGHVNKSRKIDPLISSSLFVLPIPGAEATGSNVLAFRNMVRAKFYDMASGQDLAKQMGVEAIPPNKMTDLPAFQQGTPMWFYILAESKQDFDGKNLGPVGGHIVADVFVTLLRLDQDSILRQGKNDPNTKEFALEDLFVFAGLAKRP